MTDRRRHRIPSAAPLVRIALLICLVGLAAPIASARADEAAAWEALRQGGHVALMRHTDAPGGAGDPPDFKLDDCATQRNLGAKGREDAKAVGETIRAAGITVGKLLASPWCRTVDTANLMELGPVEIAPTFSNAFVLGDQREALTAGAREIIGAWTGPGTLLVVTHGANIQALTGTNPAQGEIVVVVGEGEALREVARIPLPAR